MATDYTKRRGPDSHDIDIVNASMPVDHSQVARTGIALSDARGIEIDTDAVHSMRQLEDLKFMSEDLEVHLHDAQGEDEPQYAEITVNGVHKVIGRGESKLIPRSHVAVLAQAKQIRLSQKRVTLQDGSAGYEERSVLRLTYPFSILHDPSPKGPGWLRELLKNPT
jgi:hypothetical protein